MPIIQTLAVFEQQFPLALSASLRAESIVSFAHVPLVARHRPIAAMSLGSRRPNAFSEGDLDLLTQVASQIALALDNALAYERLNASRNHLEDQRVYLESEIVSESGFEDIIGKSRPLRKVLDQISIVAPADSTVVIYGETGTGKELIARAIHQRSSRSGKTFVRLNCAAIPSGLLESELFGHERGAFTGALAQRRGRFELADQGTLFLDEIGDISLELQPKLLRAIQEHEFERLGSSRTIHVNVRLIAATHKDLRKMIGEGAFREDLFYRLNVFPIEVPPLRERREDIPLLVRYFVSRLCRRMRKSITNIPRETMDALVAWDWPGNVRELENLIERAVILSPKDRLNAPLAELVPSRSHVTSVLTFRDGERNTIITALKAAKGKIGGRDGAAERLGLKRTTLLTKMRKLNISVERSTTVRGLPKEHR
jgi:formate hydrogenlyase transcriptional activator